MAADPSRALFYLRDVFAAPEEFRPRIEPQQITQKAARHFAEIAQSLRTRGHDPEAVAHFLDRILFCMFAEDAGLLPKGLLGRLSLAAKGRSETFTKALAELFGTMSLGGGLFGVEDIDWFNGGLFDSAEVLPRVGLVVEGRTEAAAFRKLPSLLPSCPPIDRPASVDGIGASATPEQVARRIAPDVAFLQADNKKVVVCIDRENRNASAVKFAGAVMKALEHELPPRGGSISRVAVVAADRAFEAWLLADISGLCARSSKKRKAPRKQCFEGYMRAKRKAGARGYHYGDDVLADSLGRYEKMRDGPRLFAALDFVSAQLPCDEGGRGSASLRSFVNAIRS